jgi:phosphatidate cytidylyltransferase
MLLRALTGAAYVALTLGAAWAGPFTTFLLFLPVAVAAGFELHRLLWSEQEGTGLPLLWSMALAAIVYGCSSMVLFHPDMDVVALAVVLFVLLFVSVTWMLLKGTHDPGRDLGGMLLMTMLVGLPFGAMINLFEHGAWVFVGFMIMLWTNDTGAYLVGRSVGRTKLLPAVSPNKTVEGFVGGVVFTVGVAYVLSRFHPELHQHEWLVSGAIVAGSSTIGDLLESAFKRARGVKDSGTLLPGHGGALDRFDGALLAAPALLLYLALVRGR